ncbi:SCP2 sterol-binding domain-containing protein [Bacillus sp. EB600]|uniref:SCP2 sterol-binding domain-containing protein n=1 Tax=Bacillus sp. EB600 TaxID=2806345 RepID=UPI00210AF878|nr:SCP2 sterol-binding domain-containing protein [Bacillus sp. EB600]MCQ6278999.1 SCP2 sterol-binding domain-containing protein [Bacillus sp. EB600]
MIETVQAFIQSVSNRPHVLLLIENVELTIDFIMKEESITLLLKNGEIFLADNGNQNSNKYSMRGEPGSLKDLVEGREKLRTLIIRGELQFSAPIRTLLLLEAFFYLGKTEPLFAKIS